MTATLCFNSNIKKKANFSQEDFPVNVLLWVRAINLPLAAFRPETRITFSQNRPVFGFHRRTRLDASGKTLTVCVSVSEKRSENLWFLWQFETRVNCEPLVSNLLICPEAKKTLTALLTKWSELSSLDTIIACQCQLVSCTGTRKTPGLLNTCYCAL